MLMCEVILVIFGETSDGGMFFFTSTLPSVSSHGVINSVALHSQSVPEDFFVLILFQITLDQVWEPHTNMHRRFPFNCVPLAKWGFWQSFFRALWIKQRISTLCHFIQWRSSFSHFLQQLHWLSIQCGMQSAPFFVCEDNSRAQTHAATL